MCHFYKVLRILLLSLIVQGCAYYTPAPAYYGGGYYGGGYTGYVSPSISIFTPIFPFFTPYRGYYGRGWRGGHRHYR